MLMEILENGTFFAQEFVTESMKSKANSTGEKQEGSSCLQSPFRFV